MEIDNAEYLVDHGYPVLRMKIDGREAFLGPDQKPTLVQMGYIALGINFQEDPEYSYEVTLPDGNKISLRGFTADPRVRNYYESFMLEADSENYRPGPAKP